MKKTRLFATALALCLLLSLAAGCGQGAAGSAPAPAPTSTGTAAGDADAATTLTFGSTSQLQTEPVPWLETVFMQDIQARANVQIDYTYYDEDKFNLLLASRDLPDFVLCTYGGKLDDVIAGGLALDLDPLLEQHAPNMLQDIYTQRNGMVRALKGGDEQALYFIADSIGVEYARGNKDNARGYNLRWDYYLELGAPEITDDNTYLDILSQMLAAHPETADGKPVYASGVYDSLSAWFDRGAFTQPSLLNVWTFMGSQYMSGWDDNELYNGYTDTSRSAFWLDMGFYNKMHGMGMLDPDSFTQTYDEMLVKIRGGQYLAGMGWNYQELYLTTAAEDPATLAGFAQIASANALAFTDYFVPTGTFPSYFTFISKDSPNAEAVLGFYNVLHDFDVQRMFFSGVEGTHWDTVDGVPTMRDEWVQMFADADPRLLAEGMVETNFTRMLMGTIDHPDGYPLNLMDTDEMRAATLNPLQQSVADHFGVQYPGQATYQLSQQGRAVDMSNAKGEQIALGLEAMPNDIARIVEKCNDIVYRAIPSLVMAGSQAEFDAVQRQVFSDLEAAGEATAWDWCLQTYTRARDLIEPILAQR
ncbi:hypothetical protein LJC64_01225 [Ruminococcaceae bacterium OttesenSCG-928-A11]|nr:hypothetical protein [Ruminococcaceae bacterium OttesenSCG-928-A11]